MTFGQLSGRARFVFKRISETLWVKPLLASLVSVGGVFAAKAADRTSLSAVVPEITVDSIQSLLAIMASSVLVIASLAVTSMVSAYASASNTASPRAFPLVVADDRSQYALSAFVSTFIYSIIGLIASKNEYFGPAGRFVLFALTLLALMIVVLMFVTWIDRIARLGRVGVTIAQVERATAKAMRARREAPYLGGRPLVIPTRRGVPLYAGTVGFVQHVDMRGLQTYADTHDVQIEIAALPGTFVTPDRAVAYRVGNTPVHADTTAALIDDHLIIGRDRTFTDDPRFGLVVLSQIAGRALSPAINDPGTAIDVTGVLVRLLHDWSARRDTKHADPVEYDRISVPALTDDDLFDDAFTAIERDGSGAIEVTIRLLKALESLAATGDPSMRRAAVRHAGRVVELAAQREHVGTDRRSIEEQAASVGRSG